MRLLRLDQDDKLSLTQDYLESDLPPYAILSHTWASDDEELTFADLQNGRGHSKPGYLKAQFCGRQARKDSLDYFWVDSCCIDKSSAAELSEALNSMFRWYRKAERCYVYLADVSCRKRGADGETTGFWMDSFRNSRWFARGWTLQELIAPARVVFFSRDGDLLGDKGTLEDLIHQRTKIPLLVLRGADLCQFDFKERRRWAVGRQTKRPEDKAYSLLGILGVFMAPIYGEGEHAFRRLEDEIAKLYRAQLNLNSELLEPARAENLPLDALDNLDPERRRRIMTALRFRGMDSRHASIKTAYAPTCTWIMEHLTYQAWLHCHESDQLSHFLWIKGNPGTGKSTLMKFILARTKKAGTISFFFNARGEELEKSVIGMFRSLLYQLLTDVPKLQSVLDDFASSVNSASIEELSTLFSKAVQQLGKQQLTCFIDALDECDIEEVRQMVEYFEELSETALDRQQQIRICFASRHYPTIKIHSGRQIILEKEVGHNDDLEKYIKRYLNAGSRGNIAAIRVQILRKARGVFMWVVLVIDLLNKEYRCGRIFAVEKRLEELPPRLSDLFRDIICRDVTHMTEFLLCLKLILFAKRPLSQEQFYFAMMAGLDDCNDAAVAWDREQVEVDDMARYLLHSSKGLAELTELPSSPCVQFIHESVKDFLLKDDGLRDLFPDFGTGVHTRGHEVLKHCCMKQLRIDMKPFMGKTLAIPEASSKELKEIRRALTYSFPFLEYAARHIFWHADQAAQDILQEDFIAKFPKEQYVMTLNILHEYQYQRYTTEASMMYLFAEHNAGRLVSVLHHLGVTRHIGERERYAYPIIAAAASGAAEAFVAITGDNSVAFPTNFFYTPGQNPLHWALSNKEDEVAAAIISNPGAIDISAKDKWGRDALWLALYYNCQSAARLLLSLTVLDPNSKDKDGTTAFSAANRDGRTESVDKISEYGFKVDFRDCFGMTPLMQGQVIDISRRDLTRLPPLLAPPTPPAPPQDIIRRSSVYT